MQKAFLFDLDGVIVDTAKYHFLAWQKLAQSLGIDFSPEHNENLKGVSRLQSLEMILALGNIQATSQEKEAWMSQKNNDYLSYIENIDESEILEGVLPVLLFIKQKKHKIGLGSASKNAQIILERTGLLPLFDVIIDGNSVSQAKPNPEVFLLGSKALHTPPQNCIVFEDAIAGIQAANAAQMTSIGIGQPEILTEADYVFENFNYIDTSFLEGLMNK